MSENWVYAIQLDDDRVVYASGDGKNEAWGKVGFEGSMIDSWSPDQWEKFSERDEVTVL